MINLEKSNQERANVIVNFITYASSFYVLPLYLLFSIADYVWYKEYFNHFLFIRICATIILYLTGKLILKKKANLNQIQIIATIFILFCILPIQYMIYCLPSSDSPYYGGLVLIIVGIATGIRYTWDFYFYNMAAIYIPYFIIGMTSNNKGDFWLNSIFFISVGIISTIGRLFFEKVSNKEFQTREQLEVEIENRGEIIKLKTDETIKLNSLSKQFSPQVIKSIREGSISFNSTQNKEICAVFIDIKDSTSRFSTLESDEIQKVISMYMEDVMSVLLKYDITIDKFLGDGILAFSNDPVTQDDYIERVVRASFEIVHKLEIKSEVYKRFWKSKMDIRIGISTGLAAVGFYGSDMHVKSYTALGKVLNLASRVNSAGNINEITASFDVVKKLQAKKSNLINNISIEKLPLVNLKGFESESIELFKLTDQSVHKLQSTEEDFCPHGHGPLFLHCTESGIYILKCRHCEYILEDETDQAKAS